MTPEQQSELALKVHMLGVFKKINRKLKCESLKLKHIDDSIKPVRDKIAPPKIG